MSEFTGIELGPKMLACSEMERKFVFYLLTTTGGNRTEAARLAGYSDPGKDSAAIRVRAFEVGHRQRVIEAMEEFGRTAFSGLLAETLVGVRRILENPDHADHAKTLLSMLSRLGFGERSGVDVNVSGEVALNHTDKALEDLRILTEMGASEEKLVEVFGHSGLGRYRKMLEEKRSPKLIEGKADPINE